MIIEKTHRLTHGFRNVGNYRIRILLAADGTPVPGDDVAVGRGELPTLRSEDPD
ncbi:hypothetical protein [Kineococcus rhizosphaerae]|uniref:hypothetical protein n=1 Tax=Kineococcus rhizosphaerae TaxID=559628 RepID=UPI001473439E|nr:hypothetical protein [Kineococcus rhizosphaerae]